MIENRSVKMGLEDELKLVFCIQYSTQLLQFHFLSISLSAHKEKVLENS